jgi:hypothetical protein
VNKCVDTNVASFLNTVVCEVSIGAEPTVERCGGRTQMDKKKELVDAVVKSADGDRRASATRTT